MPSAKVTEHSENPRNVGTLNNDDPRVGTALVGQPNCGDVARLQIQVGDDGRIEDAKFKTFGCGTAIAAASFATERIKGLSLDEAVAFTAEQLQTALEVPPEKAHCCVLIDDCVKSAVREYRQKSGLLTDEEVLAHVRVVYPDIEEDAADVTAAELQAFVDEAKAVALYEYRKKHDRLVDDLTQRLVAARTAANAVRLKLGIDPVAVEA